MAASRSWVNAPMVAPVLMILKAFNGEASVATTSAVVMGSETGPACRMGWPQASSCFGIDVGDRAGGRNLHVAADQLRAHRRSRLHAGFGGGRGLGLLSPGSKLPPMPPAATCSRLVPAICLLPQSNRLRPESAHHQRRFHHLEVHVRRGLTGARADSDKAACVPLCESWIGRSRTSSICSMGVMPAIGSLLNWPMR